MNRDDAISSFLGPDGPDDDARAALAGDAEALAIGEELARVRDLLGAPELWSAPPDHVGEALFAAIDAECSAESEPADASGLRLASSDGQPATGRSPRARSFLGTALPTAVAAAVVAFVLFTGTGSDDPTPSVEVALAASELAPEAVGTVGLVDAVGGLRVHLKVDRLPAPPDGSFYQAWMIGDAGVVAVGTFHGVDDGKAIILWSGVSVEQYPVFTVTLEPDDGNPSPSSQQVLMADLSSP